VRRPDRGHCFFLHPGPFQTGVVTKAPSLTAIRSTIVRSGQFPAYKEDFKTNPENGKLAAG
jgi:hypothetical protein